MHVNSSQDQKYRYSSRLAFLVSGSLNRVASFIEKADLTKVLLGQTTFSELLESGVARTDDEASNLMALGSVIEMPNPKFEILPLKK
jgi:hypothetical protein